MFSKYIVKRLYFTAIFLIIASILNLCMLASCGDKSADAPKEQGDSSKESATADSGNSVTETVKYESNAPIADYGGADFHVLIWADYVEDIDYTAEEQNGETINDAVYRKNLTICEMFNLKIVTIGIWPLDHVSAIRKAVGAGENSYDIALTRPFENTTLSQEGLLYNLNKISSLDLSQPWWDSNAVEELSIMNKLYMTTGDISMMYKRTIGTVLFNKKIIEDFDLGNPYLLVEQNKWTMDVFLEMSSKVSQDLNGNNIWDDDDRYGILGHRDITSIALIGGGVKFATKNSEDIPEITFNNEKSYNIFEKLTQIIYKDEVFWSSSIQNAPEGKPQEMFINDQFLFHWGEFHAIPEYRMMDTNFGILPMPKYDSFQESYHHAVNPHVTPFVTIPLCNPDPESTGAVLSHMGAISKNLLTPAYYDISLKGKHTRDEESRDMLDLILSTMTYDAGHIYGWGNIGSFMHSMADTKKTDLFSQYEKIESTVLSALNKTLEGYAANE